MSPPEPDPKIAILPHARTGLPVRHMYVASVLREIPNEQYIDDTGRTQVITGGPAWMFIFESQETDPALRAQRVWGFQYSRREGEV